MKRSKYLGDALQSQRDLDEFDNLLQQEKRTVQQHRLHQQRGEDCPRCKKYPAAQIHAGGPGSGRYPAGSGGQSRVSPQHLAAVTQALESHDFVSTVKRLGSFYDDDAAFGVLGVPPEKVKVMEDAMRNWIIDASPMQRRSIELAVTDPSAADSVYRAQYEVTQAKLRMLYPNQKGVTLYRGLNTGEGTGAEVATLNKLRDAAGKSIRVQSTGGADSWTDDRDIAHNFAGEGVVIAQKVPMTSVFAAHNTERILGDVGGEHEFIVVPQNHVYPSARVVESGGVMVAASGDSITISLDDFDVNWLHKKKSRDLKAGGPGSGRYPAGSGGWGNKTSDSWGKGSGNSDTAGVTKPSMQVVAAYHGTTTAALKQIAKDGLKPGAGIGNDQWARDRWGTTNNRAPSVFVTGKPGVAAWYADNAETLHPGSKAVVLKLTLPTSYITKNFKIDEASQLKDDALRTTNTIPSKFITGYFMQNDSTVHPLSDALKIAAARTKVYYSVIIVHPLTHATLKAGGPGSGRYPAGSHETEDAQPVKLGRKSLDISIEETPAHGNVAYKPEYTLHTRGDHYTYKGTEFVVHHHPTWTNAWASTTVDGRGLDWRGLTSRKATVAATKSVLDSGRAVSPSSVVDKNVSAGGPGSGRYPAGSHENGLGNEKSGRVFVSPNEGELNEDQAKQALKSPEQQKFLNRIQNYGIQLYHRSLSPRSALGVWSDGAENSTMTAIQSRNREKRQYLAAKAGKAGNQKYVLDWENDKAGPHQLYVVNSKENSDTLNKQIVAAGVENRTVMDRPGGSRAYVIDMDGSSKNKLDTLRAQGAEVRGKNGHATFIGADDRQAAKGEYNKIISAYETRHGARIHGQRGSAETAGPAETTQRSDTHGQSSRDRGDGHDLHGRNAPAAKIQVPIALRAESRVAAHMMTGWFRIVGGEEQAEVVSHYPVAERAAYRRYMANTATAYVFDHHGKIVFRVGLDSV